MANRFASRLRGLRVVLSLGLATGAIALAACVGDDPAPVTVTDPGSDGGGTDTSTLDDSGHVVTDSGGPADTGADTSGPFTPADLAGLALWLDGDVATANVNGTVDSWHDKSSFGNNATTANASQKPVLLTGADSINGHQALRFDGVASFFTIADNASLQWNQSFVVEAVFRHAQASASQSGPLFNKQTATALNSPQGPSLGVDALLGAPHSAYTELQVGPNQFIDTDKTTGFAPGVHRVRAAWDLPSSTLSLQIDKGAVSSMAVTGVTNVGAAGHDVLIGTDPNNSYMTADVAEIVAVTGATISDADITTLQAFLDKKYGL